MPSFTRYVLAPFESTPGPDAGPGVGSSFAELAGRVVAVIDRMRQELFLTFGPELADLRVSLDHGVPELFLVVAEHLLLFDFLDVDVLDRFAVIVELDRATRG